MNVDKDAQNKIEELQILENNFQNFLIQKQSLQIEINEINNAVGELKNSDGEVYKVVSGVILKSDRTTLFKELEEKKKALDSKILSIQKQGDILEKNAV